MRKLQPPDADAPPPLAELAEAVLDAEGLLSLLEDIATHATHQTVFLKGAPQGRAQAAQVDLPAAGEALTTGQARGLQVRYRWQGEEYWDTVLAHSPGRWRVVRIQR